MTNLLDAGHDTSRIQSHSQTGASDGISRAFAAGLAARGLDLVLVARRADVLTVIFDDLSRRHGVAVRAVALDVVQPGAAAELMAEVEGEDVRLLVAAAGQGSSGPVLAQDADEEVRMADLNCRAVVELAHGVGTRLSQHGRGGPVLFGSLVGFQAAPWSATHAATRAFVQSLAEGFAVEWAPGGVAVLLVASGPIATGFDARARINKGQAARPEAVAEGALRARGSRGLTVRPGLLSKGLGWSLGLLPRAAPASASLGGSCAAWQWVGGDQPDHPRRSGTGRAGHGCPVPRRPAFAISAGSVFLLSVDGTIAVAAFPVLRVAFPAVAPTDLSWVLNAYTILCAARLVPARRVVDLRGAWPVFLAGSAVFTLASVAGGLVTGPASLVAARAVQAVGGALLSPASLALVLAALPLGGRTAVVGL